MSTAFAIPILCELRSRPSTFDKQHIHEDTGMQSGNSTVEVYCTTAAAGAPSSATSMSPLVTRSTLVIVSVTVPSSVVLVTVVLVTLVTVDDDDCSLQSTKVILVSSQLIAWL